MDINELKFKLDEKRKSGTRLSNEQRITILKISNKILKESHQDDHCIYIAIEELSELIAAINDYACFGFHQANLGTSDKLIHLYEEIADATIVIDKVYDWFNIQQDFTAIGNESTEGNVFNMNRTVAAAANAIQSITKYLRYRDEGTESEVRLIYEMAENLKELKRAIYIMISACNSLDIAYITDIKYERQCQRNNNAIVQNAKILVKEKHTQQYYEFNCDEESEAK